MSTYQITNRITKEQATMTADSAQEACERMGWMIGDCHVRQLSDPPPANQDWARTNASVRARIQRPK